MSINDILNMLVRSADFLCKTRPLVCEDEHTVLLTNRRTGAFLKVLDAYRNI